MHRRMTNQRVLLALTLGVVALGGAGCDQPRTAPAATSSVAVAVAPQPTAAAASSRAAAPERQGRAPLGEPAPAFELVDLDGKRVSLADHRGKVVVLEWFNPECPFVKAAHGKGSLKGAAARHRADGVVWLAVNSAAQGKQGHGAAANRAGASALGIDYPILADESGAVGKAYGAERTPHLFVIDRQGILRYAGAVDNSPDGEGQSPAGGTLVRHADDAIAAVLAGRPVPVAETKPYGCTVKYAG